VFITTLNSYIRIFNSAEHTAARRLEFFHAFSLYFGYNFLQG